MAGIVDRLFGRGGEFTLAITNDPDHGTTEDYRRVFDALNELGVKVTTAVFCRIEDDGSPLAAHCRKGETHSLEDREYADLMVQQKKLGHEIAYHGYSQVSNTREKFLEGLEIFKGVFGEYPYTYIEHGGHPDTHEAGMVKRETLAAEGRKKDSPYYVADIAAEQIPLKWAWPDLLGDYEVRDTSGIFYRREEGFYFRRWRMHYLEEMAPALARADGVFAGYTHFGYRGFEKVRKYRLENWVGAHLENAKKAVAILRKKYKIRSVTLRELAEEFRDGSMA